MTCFTLETSTHGRVLVEEPADPSDRRLLVVFHGYAQSADDILSEARQIPGVCGWCVVSVQALHRFYARDRQKTVASWMTREDRELAVADNVTYVDRVIDRLQASTAPSLQALVFLGFSQGAAMAYRAALLGRHRANGVIALGGDIPPELTEGHRRDWPAVLLGAGADDEWYTPDKLAADLAFLSRAGIRHDIARFAGGHEWTGEFRDAAGAWLDQFK